jgi:transcription initiation factor IIE alpha subunit
MQILISNEFICELSKNNQKNITKSTLNFIRQIKYFMEFIISKLKLMPSEERENELYLCQVCKDLDQTKLEMTGII